MRCLCDEVFNYMKVCNPSVAGGCELRRALENVKDTLALFSNSLKNENSDDAIITPVNNAACRNALEEILEKIDKWRTDNVMEHWQYSQLFDIADAALAKPYRNCDMFGGDYKMLHTAWFDWTGSPDGHNDDSTVKMPFGEWLLAKARGCK